MSDFPKPAPKLPRHDFTLIPSGDNQRDPRMESTESDVQFWARQAAKAMVLQAENDRLERELAEARKDAERYRFLATLDDWLQFQGYLECEPEGLGAYIDSLIAESKREPSDA